MEIEILSWNVHGLNEVYKRSIIKSMIHKWRAYILCSQESKIEEGSPQKIREIDGLDGSLRTQLGVGVSLCCGTKGNGQTRESTRLLHHFMCVERYTTGFYEVLHRGL